MSAATMAPPPTLAAPRLDSKLAREFVTSGISVGCATVVTNPIDLVKTRMQLQHGQAGVPQGLVGTGVAVVRGEGIVALWRGLVPAVLRGLVYGGLRLGLYSPIKAAVDGDEYFGRKLFAGSLSGGLAAAISSPTELIKTRLQAPGSTTRSAGEVVRQVVAADGIKGLWKGATPGLIRASVLTASQCATYDDVKRRVMTTFGWGDTVATHLVTALCTGLVSTTATNGVDVVKTRMFVGGSLYANPWACTVDVYRRHGLGGFMRGWTANYARLGPQTVVVFLVAEQLRALSGLNSL